MLEGNDDGGCVDADVDGGGEDVDWGCIDVDGGCNNVNKTLPLLLILPLLKLMTALPLIPERLEDYYLSMAVRES